MRRQVASVGQRKRFTFGLAVGPVGVLIALGLAGSAGAQPAPPMMVEREVRLGLGDPVPER